MFTGGQVKVPPVKAGGEKQPAEEEKAKKAAEEKPKTKVSEERQQELIALYESDKLDGVKLKADERAFISSYIMGKMKKTPQESAAETLKGNLDAIGGKKVEGPVKGEDVKVNPEFESSYEPPGLKATPPKLSEKKSIDQGIAKYWKPEEEPSDAAELKGDYKPAKVGTKKEKPPEEAKAAGPKKKAPAAKPEAKTKAEPAKEEAPKAKKK